MTGPRPGTGARTIPTATYLTTATVGDFIYREESMVETSTGRTLPVYNAIDSSATPTQLAAIDASLAEAPAQVNFLSDIYGPYPFDSTGAVADRATGVGYALEVQTKPHYSGNFVTGDPSINISTQPTSSPISGSATAPRSRPGPTSGSTRVGQLVGLVLVLPRGGRPRPGGYLRRLSANTPAADWETAPAILDGDPANLFHFFPTYQRGAMTVQGYREIVGDDTFFELAWTLLDDFGHGNVSTEEFIETAKEVSGLTGADSRCSTTTSEVALRDRAPDDPARGLRSRLAVSRRCR